ncbi:MAG: amidohydrolase family protein [Bacteroidia bacterium]|nr:amidohydrolase family protein [Bacteroidia bacterium]
MIKKIVYIFFYFFVFELLYSQTVTFPHNGAPDNRHTLYALTGLEVYQDEKNVLKNATILIKDGKITDCGTQINIPPHAIKIELKGCVAYPSFIDLFSFQMIEFPEKWPIKPGSGWNPAVMPHELALDYFKFNEEKANEYRKSGFGVVLSSIPQGIFRGYSVLTTLNNQIPNLNVIKEKCAQFISFNKGKSPESYPSSLTGAIALIRQTFYDALWYSGSDKKEKNISLEAINQSSLLPVVFDANDKWNIFRAYEIAKEFKKEFIYKTSGNEYQRIHELAELNLKYIVPLQYPEKPLIQDPLDGLNYSLPELRHWEMAPMNPAILEKWNLRFCLTMFGLNKSEDFFKNLFKAMDYGLSHEAAIKALTSEPAKFIGMENELGYIRKGMMANIIIANTKLGDKKFKILHHWIQGTPYIFNPATPETEAYQIPFSFKNQTYQIFTRYENHTLKFEIKLDTQKVSVNFKENGSIISFQFSTDKKNYVTGLLQLGPDKNPLFLALQDEKGKTTWYPVLQAKSENAKPEESKKDSIVPLPPTYLLYPHSSYGYTVDAFDKGWKNFKNFINADNQKSTVLIKNATLWTNDTDSILEGYDLLIENKKISKIGKKLQVPADAMVIEGNGLHVTPGIIDEHSHIALQGGVNEGTQASTAEVRMGDVVNPDDVNIFRNLAGGVTAVQLLHGSANPIGGQSGLIKHRWGCNIQDMKIEDAPGFIKFALGENVKQSNWGDHAIWRFPQTRMGVEQVFVDHFIRAKEYLNRKKDFYSRPKIKGITENFRIDLEMEALGEILEGKRHITCHSYVQSEINMLMKVADSLGFKVNTFTHILEGYKVADKMKKHGANASSFADWWAYKNEVMEAIPYNAALLTRVGVNTAINSDDAEMSRRLNHEAAKSIRYGGLSPVQSLKLVTLNPAKMLRLNHRMGMLKPGMDADIVIWSGPPLSIYSKAEKTFVDGVLYYDRSQIDNKRNWIESEKQRIIQFILQSGSDESPKSFRKKGKRQYHCNSLEWVNDEELEHIR